MSDSAPSVNLTDNVSRHSADQGGVITADVAAAMNFASWLNSVPLLRTLTIGNTTSQIWSNLRLDLQTSPAFARAKTWHLERINPGEHVRLGDRDVQIDPDYLNGLNEAERGQLQFRLWQGDQLLAESIYDIRILARDEWGGMSSMAELLAAFVMPNDPGLARVLKRASNLLARHGHSSALDGYQSGDPRRAYMLAAAVWSAVAAEKLSYTNPPASFERSGQKVRRPSVVLSDGLATCLDTSLLFAAALEAIGLNTIIVMQDGHCFTGVWLVERTLPRIVTTECSEIRKAIDAHELRTFETTLVTHNPPARFEDAIRMARDATREAQEGRFLAAIDIARARMSQIRPLASHEARELRVEQEAGGDGSLPLPKPPDFGGVPAEIAEERPSTPAGRIERWQRKLLDLSLRNRLLNFRSGQSAVPVLCPDAALLEDRLAAGGKLRLISLPEHNPLGERDAQLHQQTTHHDINIEFARQALVRDELCSPLGERELANRLTSLYRKVRNDLAEGGSNTLYLAVGFLRWKQRPTDSKSYLAPLLLVPVKLTRKSAISPYLLSQHEDDVRFNATLIQLLLKDFGRDISAIDANLPMDEHGVDVPRMLDWVRHEVRDIPGFEVVDDVALSTFSFAKYLMWKDLVDRIQQLEHNRVVRHLIRDPDKPFQSDALTTIPAPYEIDKRYEPKELVHILPADSSQVAAVMAASEGHDFVLIGPPGTGKSQTIANIIAQCLATGKSVLFVAEKTAALDVVYRRLRDCGLGDCCIELHSNRAERRRFLDQLKASWENNRRSKAGDWLDINKRLKIRRDELNAYVDAIHEKHPNGWTVFQALGLSVAGAEFQTPQLYWPDTVHHDVAAYQDLLEIARELGRTFAVLDPDVRLPVAKRQWSAGWEAKLLADCARLKSTAVTLRESLEEFAAAAGLSDVKDGSARQLENFRRLAHALLECAGNDARVMFNKQFGQLPKQIAELQTAISEYRQAENSARGKYSAEILPQIPLDDLDHRWRAAKASFFLISWFAKRKVTRLLQSYASEGQADPATDLAALRTMQKRLADVSAISLPESLPGWRQLDSDLETLRAHVQRVATLREAIIAVGQSSGTTNAISRALLPALGGEGSDLPVYQCARTYCSAWEDFQRALQEFSQTTETPPVRDGSEAVIAESIAAAERIESRRHHLQRWTFWCDAAERAKVAGLSSFVAELESGALAPDDLVDRLRLAYARWWLPRAIDRSPVLRGFQRFKHEDIIEDFRRLDDLARRTASAVVRRGVAHDLPESDGVPRRSELGMLRHQIGLTRPSKSIREVISNMPTSFPKLARCLLMSPLSIAQYLPPEQTPFDVVIFDEASQITTWDAIGAIARGRQTIIVGDPKQLPPTNFFGRLDDDEQNEELEDHEKDLESILDEAQASGLPVLQLNWHYRSQHESLIAFSNWHYYGNKLITFPAADSEERGVVFRYLEEGVYDRGKSRTNRVEAEAIVRDAVQRMQRELAKPEDQRRTFGVITFNIQQQGLIEDLFEEALRENPELEWFFADDRIEPTVVKNLENVQGDERDVMYFSVTFGRDQSQKFSMNFGALNRDGGERRLNVAITRARRELLVYSSFKGEALSADRTDRLGVLHLKYFLEFAEKGANALPAAIEGSVGDFESPFEEAVAAALKKHGWQVVPQIGVSGFRVDLGVVHPDKPGSYLAGVECDGATYHRSAVARDRDKIRQQVLEGLGWNILRVWSPDWWYDCQSAVQRVHEQLTALLESDRRRNRDKEVTAVSVATPQPSDDPKTVTGHREDVRPDVVMPAKRVAQDMKPPRNAEQRQLFAGSTTRIEEAKYYFRRAELPDASSRQHRFFEHDYSDELRAMLLSILQQEQPIREDVLVRQIARVHGFARAGGNIRKRVIELLDDVAHTEETTGRFLWVNGPAEEIPFRHARDESDRRSLEEISMAELIGLVRANPHLRSDNDPALSYARLIGIARLSKTARERLEAAIAAADDVRS